MIELGKAHSKPSDLALPQLTVPDTTIITAEAINAFDATWIEKWTQVTGDVAVFDMNYKYSNAVNGVFNQQRDWDGQATMEDLYIGKLVTGVRYWFAVDATNANKKVRRLVLLYWNGTAWITHATLTTSAPAASTMEEFDLTANPMPNPTGRIRIQGKGNWANISDYYRWVTECTVRVGW